MTLDAINAIALAKRASLSAENHFLIPDLNTLPPYFGFVDCKPYGFVRLCGGADDGIAFRFFWNGSYEKHTLALWSKLASRCELALDIGAHTGVYTLAAKAANPGLSVGAFEPNPINYSRLCLNMSANNLHLQNAVMKAVGDKDETLPFSIPANSYRMTSAGALGNREGMSIFQAQVVALDNFLPAELYAKVGMVKIDVEGHEGKVIEGMAGIIATAKPTIFFECIDAQSGRAVEQQLTPMGYRFYEVDDDAGTVEPVAAIRPHLDSSGDPIHSKANRIACVGDLSI